MKVVALILVAVQAVYGEAKGDASPVSKVVRLLKDMQSQLIADKKADEEMYEALSCWCKKNGDGKDTAVQVAEQTISNLGSEIEALSAKQSELEQSISTLGAEVTSNTEALATATKLREEELAKFNGEEKDMVLAIDSLSNALVVLDKVSFLQVPKQRDSFLSVREGVKKVVASPKAQDILSEIFAPSARDELKAFLQGKASAAQSGEIIGILKQMKTEFGSNLKQMRGGEDKAVLDYTALKEAKTSEIDAGEKMIKEKTALLGRTKVKLSSAKEDSEDTTTALDADRAFLLDLKERCSVSDAEWEERSKTRAMEIQAVTDTIGFLADEDSHDTFHRTMGFLQLSSTRRKVSKEALSREHAAHLLLQHAKKGNNKVLAQLATTVKATGLNAVVAQVEKMIADIKKESDDEVHHRDFCIEQFHKSDMDIKENDFLVEDLTTKVNDLATMIETLTTEIAALKQKIEDLTVGIQRANELRIKENKEFQSTIADQRATQAILKKALGRLADFYSSSLVQVSAKAKSTKATQEPGAAAPPPPPSLGEYKSNEGAGSVMTMIESIIKDAKDMEAQSIKMEQEAEVAYQSFMKESHEAIDASGRAITDKTEKKAQADEAKVAAEGDKADAVATAEALAEQKAELHASCDFIMENFDVREEMRQKEAEQLNSALQALYESF
jgi:hypothetical protein